ncbi:MAG: hypothetical protein IPP94_01570 [Ignavibacteria bacterium]|nr:hypothetical protein [Ignavibacteria bacterium]
MGFTAMYDFGLRPAASHSGLHGRAAAFAGIGCYGFSVAVRYNYFGGFYASLGCSLQEFSDPFQSSTQPCEETPGGPQGYILASLGVDLTYVFLDVELHRQIEAGGSRGRAFDSNFSLISYGGPGKPIMSYVFRASYKIEI